MKLFIGFLVILGAISMMILLLFLFCALQIAGDDKNDE